MITLEKFLIIIAKKKKVDIKKSQKVDEFFNFGELPN